MKKTGLVFYLLIGLGLFLASISFFLKSYSLKVQLAHYTQMIQNFEQQTVTLQAEKEKISRENDKLQQDAVVCLALNTKLQNEKEKLEESTEEAQKATQAKEIALHEAKEELEKLQGEGTSQKGSLYHEKEAYKKRIAVLENTLQKERELYHYNLAVAYTQAKLYDKAIESYEKSLSFNQNNAEAHYNLGLLYEKVKKDQKKAKSHYRNYLKLKPEAEDREEVQSWIDRLK